MTVTAYELLLYAGGMLVLFMVPGPVWVALTARTLSGGFAAAWPLAIGVSIGDLVWPLLAIYGLTWVLSVYGDFLHVLRWIAAATFIAMGLLLIRKMSSPLTGDSRMTRPGRLAGFLTGLAAVIGNPKGILFYMGILPGFFDLSRVNVADVVAILVVSVTIPLIGNLCLALFINRARRLLSSADSLRKVNLFSGILLIGVGIAISLT